MKHPFIALKPEYSQLLAAMVIRPEKRKLVDDVALRILGVRRYFDAVKEATGVPIVFSGPSFEREASLNFNLSPAQGDPWRRVSTHVPAGLGPYKSWQDAAIDTYRREGLDRVGAGNWTWELVCYYGELFNGFGYRDYHSMHSPYLWGGTNIQTVGKDTSDGKFDPDHMDEQLGMIPVARRIADLSPDLALPTPPIPAPQKTTLAAEPVHDTTWLQNSLVRLGFDLDVDGSYGRQTKRAVARFEHAYGLKEDGGYAGPEVFGALEEALKALDLAEAVQNVSAT